MPPRGARVEVRDLFTQQLHLVTKIIYEQLETNLEVATTTSLLNNYQLH